VGPPGNRAPAWLDGVVRGAEEEGLNHQVVSFKSPADTPAIPGMLRKPTAFVPRYQKFESISLQQTVRLSPAEQSRAGSAGRGRQAADVSARGASLPLNRAAAAHRGSPP
jgi:hypothetical protein